MEKYSTLRYSLFSAYSNFQGDVVVADLYHDVSVGERVVRKKLCKGGFKRVLRKHKAGEGEEVSEASVDRATFVEFKVSAGNIVVGIYSNGKIRMAGKMPEPSPDRSDQSIIDELGRIILREMLGIAPPACPFVVNNITAMFRTPHSVLGHDVAELFRDHVDRIVYPGGEVPPYTVVRLCWKKPGRAMVNYTPNTGAYQILGCQTTAEIKKIHDVIRAIFADNRIVSKRPFDHTAYQNKFASVGMRKEGRGRPSRAFTEEYKRRMIMMAEGKGGLDGNGEWQAFASTPSAAF